MEHSLSHIFESLLNLKGLEVQRGVPLANHTTWKVGGPVELLVRANGVSSLDGLLEIARAEGIPLFVLGNGSNILVSDAGLKGIALRLGGELTSIEIKGEVLTACGGAPLGSLVENALKVSLKGVEFAFGIPGTVGGAVMTNAGAFSGSIAEVVDEVQTMNMDGEMMRHRDMSGEYRSPLVPRNEIVTRASFRLTQGSGEQIRKEMDSVRAKRKATQPWGMATAGSVFKNPAGDSAGRMIEECGLKGKSIGKARVSDTHANFIINDGGALASDIKELIDLMRREVRARFGLNLEQEITLVGFDEE